MKSLRKIFFIIFFFPEFLFAESICGLTIPLPNEFVITEKKKTLIQAEMKQKASMRIFIAHCKKNEKRTSPVTDYWNDANIKEKELFYIDNIEGILIKKDGKTAAVRSEALFATRDTEFRFVLISIPSGEAKIAELASIVKNVSFEKKEQPAISEDRYRVRFFVFISFLFIIFVTLAWYTIYRFKYRKPKR